MPNGDGAKATDVYSSSVNCQKRELESVGGMDAFETVKVNSDNKQAMRVQTQQLYLRIRAVLA
jgi:hypothetical protein